MQVLEAQQAFKLHYHYLIDFKERNKTVLISLGLISFLIGWQSGKKIDLVSRAKQIGRYAAMAGVSLVQKKYLPL